MLMVFRYWTSRVWTGHWAGYSCVGEGGESCWVITTSGRNTVEARWVVQGASSDPSPQLKKERSKNNGDLKSAWIGLECWFPSSEDILFHWPLLFLNRKQFPLYIEQRFDKWSYVVPTKVSTAKILRLTAAPNGGEADLQCYFGCDLMSTCIPTPSKAQDRSGYSSYIFNIFKYPLLHILRQWIELSPFHTSINPDCALLFLLPHTIVNINRNHEWANLPSPKLCVFQTIFWAQGTAWLNLQSSLTRYSSGGWIEIWQPLQNDSSPIYRAILPHPLHGRLPVDLAALAWQKIAL